jgi:hypothetical protein
MINPHYRVAAVISGCLLALTACGGGDGKPATSASSPTSDSSPSPPSGTTASTGQAVLTREQAAKRYLEIVAPVNKAGAPIAVGKCGDAHRFIRGESNETYMSNGEMVTALRACYKRVLAPTERWISELQRTAWPVDAREDIQDLISFEQVQLHCSRQVTRATTYEELDKAYQCWPPKDESADRVRARLGLPRTNG